MFTDREAGKAATPQLGVSVSLLLIAGADLGLSGNIITTRKHCSFPAINETFESLPHGGEGACFAISLLTQDCRVKIFPLWKETVGPVLNQFVHAYCSRDSTSSLTSEEHTPLSLQYPCRQFSMLISRTINANFAGLLRGGLSTLYVQSKTNADAQVDGEGVASTASILWWSSWQKHLLIQEKSSCERKAALRADQSSLRCLTLVDFVCMCQNSN